MINYIQAIISFLLKSFCAIFTYLMWVHDVTILVMILPIIGILVFEIFFLDAFDIYIGKSQTQEEADEYKDRLSYNDDSFTICGYSYNKEIKWETVEAIFYLNTQRRHAYSKSYRIILNAPPEAKNRTNKWYSKIFESLIKERKYPEIIINSYYNIHFYTFHSAIDKYLHKEKEATTSDHLKEKYGNKVEYLRKNANTIEGRPANRRIKSMGFYEIFDRGNILQDETLIQYRNMVKSKNDE